MESKGLLTIAKDLLDERLPKGVNWPQTLGSSLLALIVVQIATGILLSFYYSPNADVAYESIEYIENRVVFGSLIRGIHYFAASGMVILVFLHIIRTFFYGAYKRPRQFTWIFGVLLLLIVLGFGFTGYLLPWDMKAYFATKVGINIAGVMPLIGEFVVKVMQGGNEMGTITLSRFFSLHVVVLPISLLVIVAIHLYYLRLHGTTPPGVKEGARIEYANRFYPVQLFRDSFVALLVVGIIVFLAAEFGAPLEDKADAGDTSYIPRPDWYFYGLFQLLKIFEGKLEIIGAIILPGFFLMGMLFLPFIDRSPERRLSKRPVARAVGTGGVLAIVTLTLWGAYGANQAEQLMADQRGTANIEGEIENPFVVDATIGKELYEQLKCMECHAAPSRAANIPPGLEFAGNKYRMVRLIEYLQSPHRVRWESRDKRPIARMPDFDLTEPEAMNLAAFLLTRKQDAKFPVPEFDWAEADSEMVESGEGLVEEYGCKGCHKIGDAGQNLAPDLSHVGSKLLDSFLYHLVKNPQTIVPETPMKDFQLEVEDVEDIVAYLGTLR